MKRDLMIVIGAVVATLFCLLAAAGWQMAADQARHERADRLIERYHAARSRLERNVQFVNRKLGLVTSPSVGLSAGLRALDGTWDIERDVTYYEYVLVFEKYWKPLAGLDLKQIAELDLKPIARLRIIWTRTPDDEKIVIEIGEPPRSPEAAKLLREGLDMRKVPVITRMKNGLSENDSPAQPSEQPTP